MIVILCCAAVILFNIKGPKRTVAIPRANVLRSSAPPMFVYIPFDRYNSSFYFCSQRKGMLSTCLFAWHIEACEMAKPWFKLRPPFPLAIPTRPVLFFVLF